MQAFLFSESAPRFGGEAADTEYQNLSPGDRGEAVMNLQRRLVQLGYANGNPNGQYGNATISAVQLYQQSNGMDVDGLASAWLQATLFSDNALSYAQAQGIQPAEPTPEPTPVGDTLYFNLAVGATGNAVQDLQNRLIQLGYTLTAALTGLFYGLILHPQADGKQRLIRVIIAQALVSLICFAGCNTLWAWQMGYGRSEAYIRTRLLVNAIAYPIYCLVLWLIWRYRKSLERAVRV